MVLKFWLVNRDPPVPRNIIHCDGMVITASKTTAAQLTALLMLPDKAWALSWASPATNSSSRRAPAHWNHETFLCVVVYLLFFLLGSHWAPPQL